MGTIEMGVTAMKALIDRTVVAAARHLPWRVRRALLEDLLGQLHNLSPAEAVTRIMRQCGYSHVCASGNYGIVRSELGDLEILREYGNTGKWSENINRLFIDFFLPSGGTYLDIGANIGLTTIPVAQNPRVQCMIFEPEPRNFSNLSANVRLNCPHENVILYNVAAAQRRSTLVFELSSGNLGDHRIRSESVKLELSGERNRPIIEVQGEAIDNVVTVSCLPLAVKIDTQGAEPFVIEGGREVLSKSSLMVLEFAPYMMERMGADYSIVIDFLKTTFDSGAITPKGRNSMGERLSSAELVSQLEAFAHDHHRDPNAYCDVTMYRELSSA